MKLFGYIIAACVLLAVARTVVVALMLALGLALIVSIVMKPRETLGLLGWGAFASALTAHPVLLFTVVALLAVSSLLRSTGA